MSNNMECASYFKSRPEYKRCFHELRKKWRSYGRAAGRITLANASQEECRGIRGIVGRTFDEGTIRFSVAEFEAGLQRTRFAPVELGEVLACYFGEELFTNQEQKRREQEKKERFFEELIGFFEGCTERIADFGMALKGQHDFFEEQADGACGSDFKGGSGFTEQECVPESGIADGEAKGNAAAEWIKAAAETKKYGYQMLVKEYARSVDDARELAEAVGRAVCVLAEGQASGGEQDCCVPKELSGRKRDVSGLKQVIGMEQNDRMFKSAFMVGQPLAVFAANISGNPHYFDRGTTAGQLLIHAICFYLDRDIPKNAHEWRELLLGVGLMPDNVSSSVHAYGLRLRTSGGYHPAYEAFRARKEPCVVTLENLRGVIGAEAVGSAVYVVENEMVFSYLAERVREKAVTLLCTSGQPRTAALELLSLLAASKVKIYYSGDIDPEGVDIADRLWQRYGDAVQIWRMGPEDYEKSISAETVDGTRLAKLAHVRHPLLRETARGMRERGCAGYQENLLEELVRDVE